MNWFLGIGLSLLVIVWLAMEVATSNNNGGGVRPFFQSFKKGLLFTIPLFMVAGGIYYVFFA